MDNETTNTQEVTLFLQDLLSSSTITVRFSYVHVILALFNFAENSDGMGRYTLGKVLNIGEGMSRSIVTKFQEKNIISRKSQRKGHILTPEGKRLYEQVKRHIFYLGSAPDLCKNIIVKGQPYLCFVRGGADRIGLGIEARDAAIKIGGYGATCLVFQQGCLRFPHDDTLLDPRIQDSLIKITPLEEGDVIIIGAGENEAIARLAALNAALSITNLIPKKNTVGIP